MTHNPWVTSAPLSNHDYTPPPTPPPVNLFVPSPASVSAPPRTIGSRLRHEQPLLWWVGVHGGSGESTLAAIVPGTLAAGHEWPLPMSVWPPSTCVVVCRSTMRSLSLAQAVIREWAAGLTPGVEVAGLLVLSDAPGKLPKKITTQIQIMRGVVPRVWQVGWQPQWRLDSDFPTVAPAGVAAVVNDLAAFVANPQQEKRNNI